jgi:molecular chaperone DnaJ
MKSREDLYLVLEIGRTASVSDIKKAFRKLARRFHPDINPGDHAAEERFKRISEAYEVLSDARKRRFYDEHGFYTDESVNQGASRAAWGFSFEGFDFARHNSSGFGEIFSQIFGRGSPRREPESGQDLEYQVSIGFDDSIRGLKATISVLRRIACSACNATGRLAGSRDTACAVCGGSGRASVMKGHLHFAVTCDECSGTGRIVTECPECRGEGRVSQNESIDVEIPPGVAPGSRIRFVGKGDTGRLGGSCGDLYVVTNVAPHPFFKRVGDNIHCTVPISVTEAALGAKIQVPTIDGTAIVRIPPGTQNSQLFRLRGRGAPSLIDSKVRGDQYVEVRIVVPHVADERSKAILRELAKLNPEDPRKEIWK